MLSQKGHLILSSLFLDDESIRHKGLEFGAQLRIGSGKRCQASIELEGIGIDDLAITGARQSESGGGFAGSSGAAEEESVQWAVFRRNERFLVPNAEY